MDEQTQNQNTNPNADKPEAPPSPDAAGSGQDEKPQVWAPKQSSKKRLGVILGLVLVLLVGGVLAWLMMGKEDKAADGDDSASSNKTNLVYAVHWLEDPQINGIKDKDGKVVSKGLKQYLDEYEKLNPDVKFTIKQTHVSKYNEELKVAADSGAAPDIYQIYSTWGPTYVRENLFAEVPADVLADIEKNYVSTASATIDGKIRGIPTEVNTYALIYNKDLYKAAGIVDAQGNAKAPTTWAEVLANAKKLVKKDSKGAITQHGFAFLLDNDWQAVDPFLSLLFTNGGQYLSEDLTKALFNDAKGIAALEAEMQLFKDGSTDIAGNIFDFNKDGKVAMGIVPPWTKSTFATEFGDKFESTVGVAPLPYLSKPGTLRYGWFTGVMAGSAHQDEAWDFLKWFTSELQEDTGTTRYGDLLANTIGAIPARNEDFQSHQDVLGDFFTKVFVDQMSISTAEPNVLQSDEIKSTLMAEIQAAWDGKKTAKEALDTAATAVNKLLDENNQ
jgi:multiple sugar transport system substrate-binding protein